MLYELHELHKTITAPLVAWADASNRLFTNPVQPARLPPSEPNHRREPRGAGAVDALLRETGLGHRPRHGQRQSGADPHRAGAEEVILRAAAFPKEMDNPGPKLLIFAPLSGHHPTLLRDTVSAALQDFDVYITDWVDARLVPLADGPFHLDDYVDYCEEFIRCWRRIARPGTAHVISVCQPTVPVLAAVSLLAQAKDPALPKTMVMMGGPIDTAAQSDSGERVRHGTLARLVRRPGHPPRAAQLSRIHAQRVSGVPATSGFRGDERRPPYRCAPQVLQSPDRGRRRQRQRASAFLRRIQRGDGHARGVLSGYHQGGVPGVRFAQGQNDRARRTGAPRGHPYLRAASPSKASWTTSPATARPRPPTACAATSRRRSASTCWPRAWATTASSADASSASTSTRRSAISSGAGTDRPRQPSSAARPRRGSGSLIKSHSARCVRCG